MLYFCPGGKKPIKINSCLEGVLKELVLIKMMLKCVSQSCSDYRYLWMHVLPANMPQDVVEQTSELHLHLAGLTRGFSPCYIFVPSSLQANHAIYLDSCNNSLFSFVLFPVQYNCLLWLERKILHGMLLSGPGFWHEPLKNNTYRIWNFMHF